MAIDNLGYYELPLSDRERHDLLPYVVAEIKSTIRNKVITHLYNSNVKVLNRAYVDHGMECSVIRHRQVVDGYRHELLKLQSIFPEVLEFRDPNNINFNVENNDNGVISLYVTGWLEKFVTEEVDFELSVDTIEHSNIVSITNKMLRQYPDKRKENLTEDQITIIEYNEKLNELNDEYGDVDYTSVIKEIIEAAKRGDL